MIDLKEFWNKLRHDFVTDNQSNRDVNYFEEELGKFFWEEGGKETLLALRFYDNGSMKCEREPYVIINAFLNGTIRKCGYVLTAKEQNTVYCLDCLGSEKVKELIEKGEGLL